MQVLFNNVFRHNRLFNYVVIPLSVKESMVECQVGNNLFRELPLDFFERDWHIDTSISAEDLKSRILSYDKETPFTLAYEEYFEYDDGEKHAYIHFNDDITEKMVRFPIWRLTVCTKAERNNMINPFTMIMPAKDELIEQVKQDLDLMNEIRKSNEFIDIDDFRGFEFGLIKYLEKKYLRIV